ncbi:hypothetical protein AVEN_111543-1 [Araneus ventricosus]|uniref:Ubiquitin-like protease family profile domain-containing protein n=1 Tax=Araneus ventricosus TaxID=182803 RepID=A0A4Y2PEE2_ARAVE|nr:hypothetical protein AVEN_111543-1 [Araneus ventricosus]
MYASQIHRILSSGKDATKYFIGVFASDTLPSVREEATIVVNTDTHDQEGSHWLAMHIQDKKHLQFFDSYGFPPTAYGVFISSYSQQFTNIKWNKIHLQSSSSNVYGYNCVFFILKISKGYTMDCILHDFDRNKQNDFRLYQYFKKRYNVNMVFTK